MTFEQEVCEVLQQEVAGAFASLMTATAMTDDEEEREDLTCRIHAITLQLFRILGREPVFSYEESLENLRKGVQTVRAEYEIKKEERA